MNATHLPTAYEQLIHKSRYARWLDSEGRREEWPETVSRFIGFVRKHLAELDVSLRDKEYQEIEQAILELRVLPSMRLVMTAGKAVELDNIAAYNCAYVAVNNKRAFSEALYILMNGTGVGFSCERQEINKLPPVPEALAASDDLVHVADSKLGWAKALRKLVSALYEGDIPQVDYSGVRPAGARLKTFGGRASGPEPLRKLFSFIVATFKRAAADGGRKLTSIEVHDIMCMIGEAVVVGGVRRSALISLSNLSDDRMRHAKDGQWWVESGHRRVANNSVAYTERPAIETFTEEWLSLIRSKSGERGIFNRAGAQKLASRWGRRDATLNYGTNPCSEIILRDKQFCNLTTVIARSDDTMETMLEKVRIATIVGTIQSTLTRFNFLSEEWRTNTEEERLLGVSLNGIMDSPLMSKGDALPATLEALRDHARAVNEKWAKRLGIPASAAITCVKPEGTTSQLANCASGIHPRYSDFYLRRIRGDKKDKMTQFLVDQGLPVEDDVAAPESTVVFSYPIASDGRAVTRGAVSALEQLRLWLTYQRHWCEHKPSVTVYVKEHEWLAVGAWVYEHFDEVSGIAFLPHSDHSYQQAPYEELTKEQYQEWAKRVPASIDWLKLKAYETEVVETGSQELACTAGACEITSIAGG